MNHLHEADRSIRKAYHPEDLVILIVEDHLRFRKDIKHALSRHKVVFASSVEEGKLRYDESMPDITFLDIDLPDGTGFELMDYIAVKEPQAYVIMLSGSKMEGDVLTAQAKGARGYIIKPAVRSKIEQHIADYLELREREKKSLLLEIEEHRHGGVLLLDDVVPGSTPKP